MNIIPEIIIRGLFADYPQQNLGLQAEDGREQTWTVCGEAVEDNSRAMVFTILLTEDFWCCCICCFWGNVIRIAAVFFIAPSAGMTL